MEETLLKTLEHAPALLAMVLLVVFFLRFLKSLLESHAKRTDEFIGTVKELHSEQTTTRERTERLLERSIDTQAANTTATKELTRAMADTCKFQKLH